MGSVGVRARTHRATSLLGRAQVLAKAPRGLLVHTRHRVREQS